MYNYMPGKIPGRGRVVIGNNPVLSAREYRKLGEYQGQDRNLPPVPIYQDIGTGLLVSDIWVFEAWLEKVEAKTPEEETIE